ncbi:MAG: N-6 DNA methylase [Myxococcales bacterium]
MGPEELGSVYEGLLELVPQIGQDGRSFEFATGGQTKGNARKTTGSYYTPDSLVQVLLDSALEPVVKETIAKNPEKPVEALLGLAIVDPACGSGHFLLAAARRLAVQVARLTANGTPSAAEYRHALRQVVGRCIFGVDLNPMAVELCRVSLWMEAVEPGRPLTFLDSHIQQGNSLIGTTPELMAKGIPDVAWEAIEGDDKKIASALKKRNKAAAKGQRDMATLWSKPAQDEAEMVAQKVARLDAASDASVEELASKQAWWDEILRSAEFHHQKFIADSWCAAFVWPKKKKPGTEEADAEASAAPTNDVWRQIRDGQGSVPPLTRQVTEELARQYSFFHWHLVFPQVFAKGGFDVVLGNPPWDELTPAAKEFFAVYEPEIRFQDAKGEAELVRRLLVDLNIAQAWNKSCRKLYGCIHFIKNSGRFTLFAPGNLGKGDLNVYRMFVEVALYFTGPRGSAAQIVPEAFYNGANSMMIRKDLFEHHALQSLWGFENSEGIWFPGVHRGQKFALYSARMGGTTASFRAAFNICTFSELQVVARHASFEMPVELVRAFSPDALALMEFSSSFDVAIASKMYGAAPTFGDEFAGPPLREHMREVDMTIDRHRFVEGPQGIPVYEGRMVDAFDHRAKAYRSGRGRAADWPELRFGAADKRIAPQWYIAEGNLPEKLGQRTELYRVGFCNITGPTNERTLVATLIPPGTVCGNTVPTVSFPPGFEWAYLVWLSVANSFPMDFLARKKVSLHITNTILDSLPFPRCDANDPRGRRLVGLAARLVCTGPEMTAFWHHLAREGWAPPFDGSSGVPGELDEERRWLIRCEVDACVARDFFNLTHEELEYVMDTFPIVRKNDEKAHGEYRTKRVILEVYDAMAEAARTGKPYQTRLDPPPADPRVAHAPRRLRAIQPRIDWKSLPDGAWAHVTGDGDAGAALAAVLKAFGVATPARQVRLAAMLVLEPRLTSLLLDGTEKAAWQRVVGDDAAPLPSNMAFLVQQVDRAWGVAVRHLRASGLLMENNQAGTWAPGPGIEAAVTSGWPDGRAQVAVMAVGKKTNAQVLKLLPTEVRGWSMARQLEMLRSQRLRLRIERRAARASLFGCVGSSSGANQGLS